MTVTYLGHATFLATFGGKNLLFDPFITGNTLAKDININNIKVDYIFITHGHIDHILDVEAIARNTGASLISNFEIVSWFEKKGLQGHGMNLGGKYIFDFGSVKYVNAAHSSLLPDGTYGGNPGGFVVWNAESCFYVAGDTALTQDMQLIPKTCPKLDFAVLPIGDNFTMGYEDALLAAEYINCQKNIACHFDTFPPITISDQDKQKAQKLFTHHNRKLIIPKIGASYEL